MKLPLAIHKEAGSVYGVTVPDVPGCFSWGDTFEEAIQNAGEAIYSHCACTARCGGPPLQLNASRVEDLASRDEFTQAVWAFAEIDPERCGTRKHTDEKR